MADRKHVLHVKSNVVTSTDKYGITGYEKVSKRPNPQDILPGEIAVNYGKDGELLTIKNSNGEIVGFVNENEYLLAQKITAAAIATEKTDRINAINEAVTAQKTFMTQNIISLSYTELKALRDNKKLKPGQSYRITDYVTTTTQENTQSAGHAFDVIVIATDVDTLNENAKAIKHEGDTYFADSNLDAWEIKYDLDNDTTKYAWADKSNTTISFIGVDVDGENPTEFIYESKDDGGRYIWKSTDGTDVFTTNRNPEVDSDIWTDSIGDTTWGTVKSLNTTPSGKGVIYYMKDEYNNECPYDFKNIQFKRWAVTNVTNNKLDETTLESLKEVFVYDNDNTKFITRYAYKNSNCVYGATTHVVDSNNSDWYYTFSTFKFENNIYALDEIEDASIKGNNFHNYYEGGCFGNSIKPYGTNDVQYLNNIVFNGSYEEGYAYNSFANSFGYNSYNNTFGNGCHTNSFVNYCYNNSFGNNVNYNSFGNNCYNNSFGNGCYNNSFGNSCYNNSFGNIVNDNSFENNVNYNSFGNNCGQNSFGSGCSFNSFGNTCSNNSFGNGCYNNSFGNECSSNSFGNNCSDNSFGNTCSNNLFGNDCYGNSFGNNCSDNSFGDDVQNVKFVKDFMWYNIVENGNMYITVTSTQATSENAILRNFTIAQGVNNATSEGQRKTISHNTTNDTFKTTYQNASSQTVNV